jgi:predicted transcriptional regulator
MFFFIKGAEISKTLTLKFIIEGLLQLYNINMSFDLIKTKVLLMASISKVVFNIDGLTIHSALNIHVQQS